MNKFILTAGILLGNFFIAQAQKLELVKDISTGNGNSNPYSFTAVGSKLFFIATDDAYQIRLYVTEGTGASTQLLGPATASNGSIGNLVAYNGKLFFSCSDGINGQELWTSNGTVAGTVLFKDLYPGTNGSYPTAFTVANNKLFFMGGNPDGERRLYISDGTTAGTAVIFNNGVDILNGQTSLPVLNNDVYFRSSDNFGIGLWKCNGTLAGTMKVKGGFIPGTLGCNYAVLNNKLYFSGSDYVNGGELWVTDGTDIGTHIVINLKTESGNGVLNSGSPQALIVFNSKLYFSGGDDTHGQEIFVTDGTAAGTSLVKDLLPGAEGSVPYESTIYNGKLYFICAYAQQLWESDGTASGTNPVKSLLMNSRFGAIWNNKIYLISASDSKLWQSDGTAAGTGYVTADNKANLIDIRTGDIYLVPFGGSLYFAAYCAGITLGFEPVKLVEGTVVHNFFFTGNGNRSNPANWAGGVMPPLTLVAGEVVVIDGNCILDIAVHAQAGSSITIAAGKTLLIAGSLTII